MERVRSLGGLYEALSRLTTPVVDTTDILRAQIVLTVSALDHYVHEITRIGMLDVINGSRMTTNAFRRFQVSIEAALTGLTGSGSTWFEDEIRQKHGFLTFQQPDKIADAIRLFSDCQLWPSVASNLNSTTQDVKNHLQLIVERRNKIAHEADLDPSYPGARWPISLTDVERTVEFIENLCETIHAIVT